MTMEAAKQSVEEVGVTLQRFGTLDYIVFLLMLGVCALIGIYFGFFDGKMSAADYLMGGRSMSTFPVAMSLIASFISGITLLGTPSEIYVYGIQYVYIASGVLLMAVLMGTAFLPVFHDLRLTSTYEYLEKRFDKRVRLFGSFLFSVAIITWMPIVIYVPALAFNQVTGVNVHIITPVVCAVCIFYTCVGGLKAVVWTDVIQTFIMFGAMLLVIIKGTLDIGGISVVWERNFMSGRIEAPNFELSMMTRHTFWVLMFGGFAMWLQSNAVNQSQLQRYLSLPTLTSANRALGIFVVGVLFLIALCSYSGLLIFATFHECDPLTTKLVQAQDQLLPLLVMNTLGLFPGLPGLFMAGVFSAALSSLSTGLNSMAAVVLEDLYKSYSATPLTERRANLLMRAVVVTLGVVCVSLVFAVERLGSVLQMSMSLSGITNGASLGIFSMGLFLPWVNSVGALVGGAAGMVFMSWIVLGTQAVIASGDLSFEAKPVSVEGCSYDFVPPVDKTTGLDNNQVFALFRMSYMWYTLLGSLVSMLVALVVSYFTRPNEISSVDRKLLSPVIRRFLPRKTDVPKGVDMTSMDGCKINPPEAPEPWSGVLDATKDRQRCAQRSHPERLVVGHEDCLHLNVYTTRLLNDTKEENLLWDVVFLLHAGGFSHGSGNSIDYCPDNLLDKDLILVAPNYRLGAFGFLSTGDSHATGNYGLKDQVAALRWVQRNIVYFGGDPDSVTILGAQAGAVSAHYHILSPQSTGLFRNAISQSGTALTPWGLLDGQEARTRAFKLGKLLGCRKNDLKDSQALMRCLRMKEAGDISMQAVDTVDRVSEISYPFVPVVEPEGVSSPFLPDHPLRLMEENDAGVPWLAGVVRHEGLPQALQAMVFPALMDGLNDETDKFLLQYIGLSIQPKERARSIARKIWNYYFHNDTLEYANLARLADVTTDYHYFYGLTKTVELQGPESRAPIFVYEFSYSNRESAMVLGVPQGDDTELLFPNIISDVKLEVKKQYLPLFKRLLRIVANFARDGHPTLEESEELGSLDWPPARPGALQYLNIDMDLEVRTGFYQERMAFWESIHQELLTEYQSYDQIPTPPTKDEL